MTTNSKRSLNRSSYTPIAIAPEEVKDMAVPKFGFVKSLQLLPEEISNLQEVIENPDSSEEIQDLGATLNNISEHLLGDSPATMMAALGHAGDLGFDQLQVLGDLVFSQRQARAEELNSEISYLLEQYISLQPAPEPIFNEELPENGEPIIVDPNWNTSQEIPLSPPSHLEQVGFVESNEPESLASMLSFLEANGYGGESLDRVRFNLKVLGLPELLPPAQYSQAIGFTMEELKKILQAFQLGLEVQPYGILNLERLEFTPVGTERGELVETIPLAPLESLNYTIKESSSVTTGRDDNLASEGTETLSDTDLDKTEITKSINDVQKWQDNFEVSAGVNARYGKKDHTGVFFEAKTGYKYQGNQDRTLNHSIKSNKDLTRIATQTAKESHSIKVSFLSKSDSENTFVRNLKNPYNDRVIRVDYYNMMRKWKIDMHRYGLRITYDINVPEPGSEIMTKHLKIQEIDTALAMPFESYFDFPSWKLFRVWVLASAPRMYDVNVLAEKYGTRVTAPPRELIYFNAIQEKTWISKEEAEKAEVIHFEFPLDDRYLRKRGATSRNPFQIQVLQTTHKDLTNPIASVEKTVESFDKKKLTVAVRKQNLSTLSIQAGGFMQLRQEEKDKWVHDTYQTIQAAAKEQFERLQANLKARRAQLKRELGGEDTLSLRRIEREELMKNVLRWMFGPGFRFILPGMKAYNPKGARKNVETYYDPNNRSVVDDEDSFSLHKTVLQHGELIKFLHQAIEWENMSYSLLPYFWSSPSEWNQKQALQHPDLIHEAFLKAGSARVVLPLRPGYEEKFLWFLKNGKLEIPSEGATPPYISMARELQAFAHTNYPWLRSANPEGDFRPLLTYRQRKAWEEMEEIIGWIEQYKKLNNSYPTSLAQIDTLPLPPSPSMASRKDPWGEDYHYQFPGKHADFDLASWGANKAQGINPATKPADPEEVDITSWANSSLVATWFDYTPTNAIDIGMVSEVISPPLPTPPTPPTP